MDTSLYDQFYRIETTHWWFVARQEIVLDQIARHAPMRAGNLVLDVGCGTGIMLWALRRFGTVEGLDPATAAVDYCAARYGDAIHVHQAPLAALPTFAAERYDVITLLDVLEHLDGDQAGLHAAWAALKEDGVLVCTVPAHPALWSGHDVLNRHRRRYTLARVRELVLASGFEIERLTYFNFLLSPFVLLARSARSTEARMRPHSDFKTYPRPINAVLHQVFRTEKYLLRRATLPFGISIMCVARKAAKRA